MSESATRPLSKAEILGLRRMLLQFEAELPPHELGYWHITRQPTATVLENEDPPRTLSMEPRERILIRGHAECLRCHKRFDIPDIGNFTTEAEERVAARVADAKKWVERKATQDGPCWGDVPLLPDRDLYGATLDIAH
jgi:hypothetical protein